MAARGAFDERRASERPPEGGVPAREPFLRRLATTIAVVVVAGAFFALVVFGIDIFLAAFWGILFAVLLRAATALIERLWVPERWAYSVLLLLLGVLLLVGGVLLAPVIQDQVEQSRERVPQIAAEVEQYLEQRDWGRWILDQARDGENATAQGALGAAGRLFGTLTDWFYYFLTALFVGLFAAAKPALYMEGVASLFPIRKRRRVLHVLDELGYALRWWLVGQLLAMLLIGVSTWLVLWAFDVPLALPLGVLVGLLGFIPYIGPIVGLVPIAVVAGTQGVTTLFYVVGAYVAVQIIEGYVITPLIQHRMVYLPPVFTVITQIVLGSILGALGFILATPLAAAALVLTRFYREDVLGERGAVAEGKKT